MKSANKVDMRGKVYSYNLEEKTTDKGDAIAGTVTVQVDEDGTTVEGRFFAYPKYNSGSTNRTYSVLEDMMNGNYKTVTEDGVDEADWIAMTGSIDISYFVAKGNSAKSIDDLTRAQKIRGGFLNANKKKEYLNKWSVDMYITQIEDIEANEERGTDRFVKVKGYLVDTYNERLNEVQFEAHSAGAINYIIGLTADINNPYPVAVWGRYQIFTSKVVKKTAFGDGEDDVTEYTSARWVITGMDPDGYTFGDESVMKVEEWKEYMNALNKHKQEVLDGDNAQEDVPLAF